MVQKETQENPKTQESHESPKTQESHETHESPKTLASLSRISQSKTWRKVENGVPKCTPKINETMTDTMTTYPSLIECFDNFIKLSPYSSDVLDLIQELEEMLEEEEWQPDRFIDKNTIVIIYRLLSYDIEERYEGELDEYVSSVLFLAYTYAGPETCYRASDFKYEEDDRFWERCVELTNKFSKELFELHINPKVYNQAAKELSCFSCGV